MQKSIYISILLLFASFGIVAQTSNPFDLKWRSSNPEPTILESEVKDTPLVAVHETIVSVDSLESGTRDSSLLTSGLDSDSNIDTRVSELNDPIDEGSGINLTRVNPESADSVEYKKTLEASRSPGSIEDKTELGGASSVESTLGDSSNYALDERVESLPDQKIENDRLTSEPPNSNNSLKPLSKKTPPIRNIGIALFLVLFGLALIILTWAVNINRGFLKKIYRAALNENFSALLLREQRFASSQYLYYIVYAVFFLNGGLFLYLISRYATWDFGHRDTSVILFIAFLSSMYAVKHVVTRLLGETFQISKEMRHFNFNILLYNILAGIALMPVNLFLAFGPASMRMPFVYAGLSIIALLYFMRQSRGFIMGYHLIVKNVFQFFVYLCAIEILPVLVLFKYFPN